MKRIGIVTITNSGANFGNRLQNYALQETLKKHGAVPQTIYSTRAVGSSVLFSRLRFIVRQLYRSHTVRWKHFRAFEKKHIIPSGTVRFDSLNQGGLAKKYDAFIAGSDQVWNPTFPFNSDFEFMQFAPPSERYSYAASFGIDSIPEEDKPNFSKWLKEMQSISVRENQGRQIVKELTGREASVHVDPTMLLESKQYIPLEKRPKQPLPEKYILQYTFGDKNMEHASFINELSQMLQLPVVELSEATSNALYDTGPQHFLYLIRHADYVCTDSFHGAAFSILFHKRITVFFRSDNNTPMNSRVETLLKKMGLEDRLFGNLSPKESLDELPYHDVDKLIAAEREKANEYLSKICSE